MVDVAPMAEPNPGSFKQHGPDETSRLAARTSAGNAETTELPELTDADAARASSIVPKPVETDIEFDRLKEEEICKPGSFMHKSSETPRAPLETSPSQHFNKNIVLPNLTPDDVQKASSIRPQKVETDISYDTEAEEKAFRPGGFSTKVEGTKPLRLESLQATPSEVFDSDMVLPELTPKDLQKASSIEVKQVSGDISFTFNCDVGKEGEYVKATEEELIHSFSANNSAHSPKRFVNGSNAPTPVDNDISFSFVGNAEEEEIAYKKAAEEEWTNSKTGLQAGSLSPKPPANNTKESSRDLSPKPCSSSSDGQNHSKKAVTEIDNQNKGNTDKKTKGDDKPFDESDNVSSDDDDFQIDDSITKLEALLDNALDDQIADTFRDTQDEESLEEENKEVIARRKAELDAAFQELTNQEESLNQSFGVNEVVDSTKANYEAKDSSRFEIPPVDDPALRDSLLEFESLLESALSDDEIEISFTDPQDENEKSNVSSNKAIPVNKPATKPVKKLTSKPPSEPAKSRNSLSRFARGTNSSAAKGGPSKQASKPRTSSSSLGRFARGTSSSAAKGGPSNETKATAKGSSTTSTKGPLRTVYKAITGKKWTDPATKPRSQPAPRAPISRPAPKPVTRSRPRTAPRGPVSKPKAKPVVKPKPKPNSVSSRFRAKPVQWKPTKSPASETIARSKPNIASKQKTKPVVSKRTSEDTRTAAALPKVQRPCADLDEPDAKIQSPPKISRGVGNHNLSYSVLSLPALPAKKDKPMSMSTSLSSSKVFTKPASYFLDGSSATIDSYQSPRRSQRFACKFKYKLDAHPTRGPCELCYYHLNAEDKALFDTKGYHLRVMMCTGGCRQNCPVFPRQESNQYPVRLCRVCFFNTHRDSYQPKKKEYKKRTIF